MHAAVMRMWKKIKKMLKALLGFLTFAVGLFFISHNRKNDKMQKLKQNLEINKQSVDEITEEIVKTEDMIKKVQAQLEGDSESAKKNIKVPDSIDGVVDGLNSVLNTIRSDGNGRKQQGCDGCPGRH